MASAAEARVRRASAKLLSFYHAGRKTKPISDHSTLVCELCSVQVSEYWRPEKSGPAWAIPICSA